MFGPASTAADASPPAQMLVACCEQHFLALVDASHEAQQVHLGQQLGSLVDDPAVRDACYDDVMGPDLPSLVHVQREPRQTINVAR